MAERDLYKTLGVSRTATADEIRKAYRKIAKESHPDRNPDDAAAEERFKNATHASEILMDQKKRSLYDEFGEMGLRDGFDPEMGRRYGGGGGASAGGGFGGFDASSLEDLLRSAAAGRGGAGHGGFQDAMGSDVMDAMFGGARQARRGPVKQDVQSQVGVGFVEALKGVERSLSLQMPGAQSKSVRVRIPAGVADGGKVRLRGQGINGGDLVLTVKVDPHAHFERAGNDLLLEVPVTVGEAVAGARIPVPTLDGEVSLNVPAGVAGGARLRLRGKGVKRGDSCGDLIVRVRIVVPSGADSEELREAAAKLDAAIGDDPRKDIRL